MGRFHVRSDGFDSVLRNLDLLDEDIRRSGRSAVNKTLTAIRKKLVNEIHRDTGINKRYLRTRLKVRRAGLRRRSGYVVPSSASVPVAEYRGVTLESVSPTRARIYVPWVGGGRKLAAGFVNPRGKMRVPLRSRSHKGRLRSPEPALGPSVAAAVSELFDDDFRAEVQHVLAANFEEALRNA